VAEIFTVSVLALLLAAQVATSRAAVTAAGQFKYA